MTRYRLKDRIEFYAATPETATEEFFRLAKGRNIELVDFISADGDVTKAFISGDKIISQKGEYLVIPQDSQLQAFGLSHDMLNKIFEPVGISEQLPDSPEGAHMGKLAGKKFCVDAGHGGKDSGAANSAFGLHEKVAALDVALMLGQKLEEQGAKICFTRLSNDEYQTLTSRANFANNCGATAFISIHLNSAENRAAQGIETLVYALKGQAYDLAGLIQENMVAATGWTNRGVKARPELTVLKKTKMPAILCEIGFISNDAQAQELFKPEIQEKIAGAICDGITEFYKN